jgi:hypothetical protein
VAITAKNNVMKIPVKNTVRVAISVITGLTLLGFSPSVAKAGTNPVDLELGGEGATPWNITHIQPADIGSKTVELRNIGSKDGFVTIWISDIVSNEGVNPESETGDTTEPGEFADKLLLNLITDDLSANINLPTIINNLPQSATGREYIEIIPLKVGDTVNLQWEWELPAQTGNEIQGDNIAFTINYLLRECNITDVSGVVTGEGVFTEKVTAKSVGSKGQVVISEGTIGKTKEGQPLTEIWILETDREPPPPPEDNTIVGIVYNAGPGGTTFDRPITITLAYNPADIPQGTDEGTLIIALWDEAVGEWIPIDGCTVNRANKTISAQVSQFSRYTILAPPSSQPDTEPVEEEEASPATTILEINMLGWESSVEIGADGTLTEALTLTDRNKNFIINIDGGTRVTGSDGAILSLIELRITDESIVVPDGTIVLSPVYELTGYNIDMESTGLDFYPPARLTIRYDPQNLPENALLPFVADYTEEQDLVQLQPPPDSLVEIGKAKALISHASLFVVAVEVAPPPPPLPAKFEISNLIINPQKAYLGETVTINLTITNEGATFGSFELHLIIDGIVRAIEEVTLAAGSSETLTFELSNLAVGSHQVEVAGLTGRFNIVRMTVTPEEPEFNWFILDFSVGATLITGLLALYIVTRRSHHRRLI